MDFEENLEHRDSKDQAESGGSAVSKIKGFVNRILKTDTEEPLLEPVWDDSDEYDFTHTRRGTMVIFNMVRFKQECGDRQDSYKDVEKLTSTFTNLGFSVTCHDNLSRKKVLKALKESSKQDHSDSDCFVCFFLSHGGEEFIFPKKQSGRQVRVEYIFCSDEDIVETEEIVSYFTDDKCKSLAGKPKLFFMQACRGKSLDSGAEVFLESHDEVDAAKEEVFQTTPCHIKKDFLMMYATPPGYFAFRRDKFGSWFIQVLCEVLSEQQVRDQSLTKLLTTVIRTVSQKYVSESSDENFSLKVQTPCFISMLCKDVYLRPKIENKDVL